MIHDKSPSVDGFGKASCHLRIGMPTAYRFALNLFQGQPGVLRNDIIALSFIRFDAFLNSGVYPCICAFMHQHTRAIDELQKGLIIRARAIA